MPGVCAAREGVGRVDDDALSREDNALRLRYARRELMRKALIRESWPLLAVVLALLLMNEPHWFGHLEATDSAHWYKAGRYVTELELIVSNGAGGVACALIALLYGDRGRLGESATSLHDRFVLGVRILLLFVAGAFFVFFLMARGHWPVSGT